ncbi:MAG: DegT/DnrJ/EryC1/StrS family aminotransferase [Candidatus Electryonea clarkiae]|nr:DegT/DnrJ/EryC1/StrS family aminotransferase [Candidatus Electryonea clarkiae]MDP8285060.1 DegT/DnrJ/EryC1/StrS family aminotransferase [Candidatus Electryonea clarkiae]
MIKPFKKPIFVTRPFLPPIEEFSAGLQEIWDNQWLTNEGPVLQRFSRQLSQQCDTDNVCLFTNGTLALQIGLQGLGITGEVITTPFTFVATTHALYWNKIRPVFVDIEPDYYTLDPDKVEAAITPWTTAILAVHVFGYPCKLDELADIARRHNLKLIYDAAHAFGVTVDGKQISHFGDMSMFSFHATKLYHSLEGGMLIFQDDGLKSTFDYLKNFGFKNEVEVVMPGTNAKMNEMQALMGILVLKHLDDLIEKGRVIEAMYRERLAEVPGIHFPPELTANIRYNYAYMPIEVNEKEFGMSRDMLYEKLREYNVFARKYFYPLVTDFACYKNVQTRDSLTVANGVADRILCLPTYYDLAIDSIERICEIIIKSSSGI